MAKLSPGEKYSMPSVNFVLNNWQLIDEVGVLLHL